ncbi:hypothetical protein FRB90_004184, partial [Tulasnella sp. 427]
LSEELTKEKEAHELTRKDAATRIAILQAQLARRDAELEAHVAPEVVPFLGAPSGPLQVQPTITKSQALAILDDAAKQNRKLEAEVQRLSQQLGKVRQNERPQPAHLHDFAAQIPRQHQQVLADLDDQIRYAEVNAVELGTERMRLAYLDQISPENPRAQDFEQVLLIEDECLRLRQVERDLTLELRTLRQEKAANEARYPSEIEELKTKALNTPNVQTTAKGTTLQPSHALMEVPGIPPPYVSPSQSASHGPGPPMSRPETPPRHPCDSNPLPSPPSSTHTVRPRNRRGSESIARELLSAMEDVREKDRMLGRLKRELEELKARMLDEYRSPGSIVAGTLCQSTPPSQKHTRPFATKDTTIMSTGTSPAAPRLTSRITQVPMATKKKTLEAPQNAEGAENMT